MNDQPQLGSATPLVSVLMLAYNHERFIAQAIESILAQKTAFPFELIIGEDHSRDRTREIAERFAKQRPDTVRLITSDENVGLGRNFRRIIEAARAPYMAFCEADDFWNGHDRLAKQVAALQNVPRASFIYGDFDRLGEHDGVWRVFRNSILSSHGQFRRGAIFEDLLDHIGIHLSTMVCRSDFAQKYARSPLYDDTLRLGDVPLILFLAAHGDVLAIEESLSTYRHHPTSATQSSLHSLLRIVQDHAAVVRRFERHFGSDPERRAARAALLDKAIADAAYAAGEIEVFKRHQGRLTVRSFARLALMRIPALHRAHLRRVKRLQIREFKRASVAVASGVSR